MEGLRNATKKHSAVDVTAKVRTGYLPNVRCISPELRCSVPRYFGLRIPACFFAHARKQRVA